ncbi:MAG: hypothetical protein AAFP28_06750 [Pseudomonadota bacterium]
MKHLVFSVMVLSSTAAADPFGVKMGDEVQQYRVMSELPSFKFLVVPTPHPDFYMYQGVHSHDHGICQVRATSQPFFSDRFGDGIQDDFARYEKALTLKYGDAESHRSLADDSIWARPGAWVMSVAQKDRVHATYWSGEGLAEHGLGRIELRVDSLLEDAAVIVIEYQSASFEDCMASIEGEKNASF